MGLNKTPEELAASLKRYIESNEDNMISVLHRIGQEAVNWARENGSYTDRTGNLRNSIGYMIFRDGEEIGFEGMTQAASNKNIVQMLARDSIPKQGYALVVFAGMEYGVYVEAKGYIVLTGAVENSETKRLLEMALKKAIA